jgi:hypothetical protein
MGLLGRIGDKTIHIIGTIQVTTEDEEWKDRYAFIKIEDRKSENI